MIWPRLIGIEAPCLIRELEGVGIPSVAYRMLLESALPLGMADVPILKFFRIVMHRIIQ